MNADAHSRIGQTLGGRFTVLGVIGEGGMGAVFDVRHEYTKQRGALKLLHQRYSAVDEVVSRFINEASAAGHINSRHIVRTFDAGRLPETNEPYIFMERLEGTSLASLLAVRGKLRFDEALDLVGQVAGGLEAAHAAGIVHRDIKPDNLFVVKAPEPFVKILDFGISKFAPDRSSTKNLTREGATLGTPAYMPPEQIMGQRELDHRADIYSLGVVLYECTTGLVPFDSDIYHELCQMICSGNYVPVRQLRAESPAGFDTLVARAMAVDMKDRFASMSEFRAAMTALGAARAESFAPTRLDTQPPQPIDPLTTDASAWQDVASTQAGPPVRRTLADGTHPASGNVTVTPASDASAAGASSSVPRRSWGLWALLGAVAIGGVAWIAASSNGGAQETETSSANMANGPGAADPPENPTANQGREPGAAEVPSVARVRADAGAPAVDNAGRDPTAITNKPHSDVGNPQQRSGPSARGSEQQTNEPALPERRSLRDGLSDENPFN
jgi:serine/threonine-protein kinase